MFCRNCGAEIADQAVMCPKCGTGIAVKSEKNSSYGWLLAGSIISCFLCTPLLGWILGIISVVFSAMALAFNSAGDFEKAAKQAKIAKSLVIVNFLIFALSFGFFVLTGVFAGIVGALN